MILFHCSSGRNSFKKREILEFITDIKKGGDFKILWKYPLILKKNKNLTVERGSLPFKVGVFTCMHFTMTYFLKAWCDLIATLHNSLFTIIWVSTLLSEVKVTLTYQMETFVWDIPYFNPFPHTAILQQTTFRKILNVHSPERNEHFFKLKIFENIVEHVVCCSICKNEYLWSKGLVHLSDLGLIFVRSFGSFAGIFCDKSFQ